MARSGFAHSGHSGKLRPKTPTSAPVLAAESARATRSYSSSQSRSPANPTNVGWGLPLPPGAWSRIAHQLRLSKRETEVVRCFIDNLSPSEIAARLGITSRTVRAHFEHIYGKLGLRNGRDLILLVFAVSLEVDAEE